MPAGLHRTYDVRKHHLHFVTWFLLPATVLFSVRREPATDSSPSRNRRAGATGWSWSAMWSCRSTCVMLLISEPEAGQSVD